jgi:hypothetical protein
MSNNRCHAKKPQRLLPEFQPQTHGRRKVAVSVEPVIREKGRCPKARPTFDCRQRLTYFSLPEGYVMEITLIMLGVLIFIYLSIRFGIVLLYWWVEQEVNNR